MPLVAVHSTNPHAVPRSDLEEIAFVDPARIESIRYQPCYMGGVVLDIVMQAGTRHTVTCADRAGADAVIEKLRA